MIQCFGQKYKKTVEITKQCGRTAALDVGPEAQGHALTVVLNDGDKKEGPKMLFNSWKEECHQPTLLSLAELYNCCIYLKGLDLFDIYTTLASGELDLDRVMTAFDRYLRFVASHAPTYKEYVLNMGEKMQNPEFLGDTTGLFRPLLEYNSQATWERVRDEIFAKLLSSVSSFQLTAAEFASMKGKGASSSLAINGSTETI